MTFTLQPHGSPSNWAGIFVVFNATDQDDYDCVRMLMNNSSPSLMNGYKIQDGKRDASVSGTTNIGNFPGYASPLWYRVTCDGTNVQIRIATTEGGLASAGAAYTTANFTITGGQIGLSGFTGSGSFYAADIDQLTLKTDRDSNGSYETTEHYDGFTLDSNGYADAQPTHDAAGNLTYDGVYQYSYDAWNRLTKVTKAYRDSGGTLQTGSIVNEIEYDGFGRRIVKQVKNSTDLDCTYKYYHDGDRVVEVRNGSD